MKKLKKMIIIIIILCVIITLCLFLLINRNKHGGQDGNMIGDVGEQVDYENDKIENVVDSIDYYTVRNCINNYLSALNIKGSTYEIIDSESGTYNFMNDEQIREIQLTFLAQNYIDSKGITTQNLWDNIETYDENVIFISSDMRVIEKYNIKTFLVKGFIMDNEYNYIKDIYLLVNLDRKNKTFSIEPLYDVNYESLEGVQFENNDTEIEKKTYNQYSDAKVGGEYVAKDLIRQYKSTIFSNPNVAYTYLDEEYRNARFGSLEEFKSYITTNREELSTIQCKEYLINVYTDYTEYVCKDQFENMYIFDLENPTKYTLKLDTYTITTDEFKQQYQNSSNENKVKLNVDKWFDMINNRDYKNAFNYLDETFRTNNLKNDPNTFEAYMRDQYPLHYQVLYGEITERNGTYVQSVKLKDITGEDSTEYMLDIIMQLQDDMNFVMSFTMQTK